MVKGRDNRSGVAAELRLVDVEYKISLKLAPVSDGPIVSTARTAEKEAVGVVNDEMNKQDEDYQEDIEVEQNIV